MVSNSISAHRALCLDSKSLVLHSSRYYIASYHVSDNANTVSTSPVTTHGPHRLQIYKLRCCSVAVEQQYNSAAAAYAHITTSLEADSSK
jgi:hypothetical protein